MKKQRMYLKLAIVWSLVLISINAQSQGFSWTVDPQTHNGFSHFDWCDSQNGIAKTKDGSLYSIGGNEKDYNNTGPGQWTLWRSTNGNIDDLVVIDNPVWTSAFPDYDQAWSAGTWAKWWPMGLWIDSNDKFYTIAYTEYNYLRDDWTHECKERRLGFATSTDYGHTWTYQGDIITQDMSGPIPQADWQFYGAGDISFFIHDSYAYIYYKKGYCSKTDGWRKNQEICVARCNLNDKLASGTWKKFYNGSWNEPGLGGHETALVGGYQVGDIDMATVTYNSYLKKFVLFGNQWGTTAFNNGFISTCTDINIQDWSERVDFDDIFIWYFWPYNPDLNTVSETGQTMRLYTSGMVNGARVGQYRTVTFQNIGDPLNHKPVITTTPPSSVIAGQSYTYTITATDADGDPVTYSATSLPSWMSFDANSHVLSGTPSSANIGSNNVVLTASDGKSTQNQSFTINVLPERKAGTNLLINPGFESGMTGWSSSNDVDADYTKAGGHTGSSELGQWKGNSYKVYTYQTVTDLPNGNYSLSSWVQSSGGQITAQMEAKEFGGSTVFFSVNNKIGTWTQIQINNINVTNGQCTIGFWSDANAGNWLAVDDVSFMLTSGTPTNSPPVITSSPVTSITAGQSYSYLITATDANGDAITYSAPTLPGWLTFNPSTHILSGTPSSNNVGSYNVLLRATDGKANTDQAFTINVSADQGTGNNLITNPGFESGMTGWLTWSDTNDGDANYTQQGGHSGTTELAQWKTRNYRVYTFRTLSGLTNGNYSLKAWVKSSGGQPTAQMEAKEFGSGSTLSYSINYQISSWTQITINNINVTNGQCTIGFWSIANAGNWITVDDVEFVAATQVPVVNLLTNPGFESGMAGWLTWSDTNDGDANYTQQGGHSGTTELAQWKTRNYRVYTFRTLTGLTNGNYTLKAWVKSSGGQPTAQMEAKEFGSGTTLSYSINYQIISWTQITISNINVTNGQCTIGFWSIANAGNWITVDDVEFFSSSSKLKSSFLLSNVSEIDNDLIQLYPTLVNNHLHVENCQNKDIQLSIYGLDGKLKQIYALNSSADLILDQLPSNMYIVHINTADGKISAVKKIIKE